MVIFCNSQLLTEPTCEKKQICGRCLSSCDERVAWHVNEKGVMCAAACVRGRGSCDGVCVQGASIVAPVGFPRALWEGWNSSIPVWSHFPFMSACQQFSKPEMRIQSQKSAHWCLSEETVVTCAGAHAPRGQAVRCGEAVEHADILRRQELNELGVIKHFPLAVQDRRSLVRDVNNLPRDERDGHSKYILQEKKKTFRKKT